MLILFSPSLQVNISVTKVESIKCTHFERMTNLRAFSIQQ